MTEDEELAAAYRAVPTATSVGLRVFAELARHPGTLKSLRQLAEACWTEPRSDQSVYSAIKRLRPRLPEGFVIVPHHGLGWHLVAPPGWRLSATPTPDCHRECRFLREAMAAFMEAGNGR